MLEITNTVSLVLIHPSILIELKLSSTASVTIFLNSFLGIKTSVIINPNKVAILGHIIPAPLEKPINEKLFWFKEAFLKETFSKVSVVRMLLEKFLYFLFKFFISSGKLFIIFSFGKTFPIIPVEDIKIFFWLTPNSSANLVMMSSVSFNPDSCE